MVFLAERSLLFEFEPFLQKPSLLTAKPIAKFEKHSSLFRILVLQTPSRTSPFFRSDISRTQETMPEEKPWLESALWNLWSGRSPIEASCSSLTIFMADPVQCTSQVILALYASSKLNCCRVPALFFEDSFQSRYFCLLPANSLTFSFFLGSEIRLLLCSSMNSHMVS